MSKAEDLSKQYREFREQCGIKDPVMLDEIEEAFYEGYHQAERDIAESFARIIRGNLGGIGNGIQNMFEQLYTDITGEKMYKGFKD